MCSGAVFAQNQPYPEPRHPVQRPEAPTSINPTIPQAPNAPDIPGADIPYPDEQNPVFGGANIDSMRNHFTAGLYEKSLPAEPLSDSQFTKTKHELEKVVRFVFRYINKEDRVRRSGSTGEGVVLSQQDSPLHYGLSALENWLEAQGCVDSAQFPNIHGGAVVYDGTAPERHVDGVASLRSGETPTPRNRSSALRNLDASILFLLTDSKPYRATLDISYRHDPDIELSNVWVH
jgi:hypothetical protein